MDHTLQMDQDRVRKNTAGRVNEKIDQQTTANIRKYSNQRSELINERLKSLNKEWDIERWLEVTSGTNVLTGLVLGLTVNKKWFLLSAISASFLVQHAIQGWCPPLPVFRFLGIRTKEEIDMEREALQESLDGQDMMKNKTVD